MSAGIFSNGAVHWIFYEQYIRFDIYEGKVMSMTLPFIKWVHEYSWQIGCLWQWDGTVYCAIENHKLNWNLHELDQVTFKWTRRKYSVLSYCFWKDVVLAIMKEEGTEQARRYDLTERKFSVIAIVKGEEEEDTFVLAAVFGRIHFL
ncbi:hypothetical protein RND71_028612 [Anisodus tanguticus]|uniref:F-box associated domain-containing protein n=1 Tax=Anisodus tanguticus TaxID=243964 RepID=A0AAE1V9C4_9SOLA|nr:hypothetical protein RND71_028612 [Anisodus tanguticus]